MKRCLHLLLALVLVLSLSVCTVFAADAPETQPLIAPNPASETSPFTDVQPDDWYYEAIVEQCETYNFIKGVSDTEYDPMGALTRGQLVTILWRMDGARLLTPEKDFAKFYFPHLDTDPIAEWAQNAAVWAGFYGIVKGYPDGTFRANEPVTREQLLVILLRYVQYRGIDAVSLVESATAFRDYEDISPYAISAVNWAAGAGIINAQAEKLEPQKIVARADMASMILRLQSYLEEYDAALTAAQGK